MLVPALLGGGPGPLATLLLADLALLALLLLDARLAAAGPLLAERRCRRPLTAFTANAVTVRLTGRTARPVELRVADAPPASFEASGHRARLTLPPGGEATLRYTVTPRARGRHRFGDLHLRRLGPLGLAWRPLRLPLAEEVPVYPDLLGPPALAGAGSPDAGARRRSGRSEGREFASLRHYIGGDDVRAIDWKATARRGWPVVREWQPERNQTVWLLLDCGRHLAARLPEGRTKLDRAVDAAMVLARAAEARGDRTGVILYGAEVERVVPPAGGRGRLGPLAEALSLAQARPVESDHGAAFDELSARQRRRALVIVFTDLADPDTCALLLARAGLLRRRHLVVIAAVADGEVADAAAAWPADDEGALMRAAAERILDEREVAVARLVAAGVAVTSVPASALAAAVLARYLAAKERGAL